MALVEESAMTGKSRDPGARTPRTVHDGLFKAVFSDPALAAEELRAVLPPALAARIDWATMDPAPTSFVDAALRERIGDLVFHARVVGSGEVLLWLIEHQSSEDWWMLERFVDIESHMWRHWRMLHPEARHLPAIVPVVVYNGPRPWRAPTDMHALYGLPEDLREALGPHVLSCAFVLDDLSATTDEALRARRMDAYARLCLFAMARAAADDFLDRLAAWQGELRLVFGTMERERLDSFLFYTFKVHRHADRGTVRDRIAAVVGPKQEDIVLTVAEQFIQEGFDKGLEKGIEKGIEKGRTQEGQGLLLRLLGQRFGAVPDAIAARVNAASLAELEGWFDRVIGAATLDDVFATAAD
jgi:predicted transposase YdaD